MTANKRPVALVTGAAGGIGRATAERLLAAGMTVIALDVSEEGLASLAARNSGKPLTTSTFDLRRSDDIPSLAAELVESHGPITKLVNNAGVWDGGRVVEMTDDTWRLNFAVNVTAPFALIRALAPVMIEVGGGEIVNVSSRNAFRSSAGLSAYDASKAALVALTRTASGEMAGDRVRVNAVCPGVIATSDAAAQDPLFEAAYTKQIPMARYGRPEEIASVIAFLLSDDASYLTGQAIIVDGGQIACQDNARFMEIPGLKP